MTEKNGKRGEHDDTREPNGHWKPGYCPNPAGRPKGFDFQAALERHVKATGLDIDKAAGELADALHKRGSEGDTQAAKLWLDRCYGIQKQQLEVNQTSVVITPDEAREQMLEMMAGGGEAAVNGRIRDQD